VTAYDWNRVASRRSKQLVWLIFAYASRFAVRFTLLWWSKPVQGFIDKHTLRDKIQAHFCEVLLQFLHAQEASRPICIYPVFWMVFVIQGNLVAVGTHKGFVQVWDTSAGKKITQLQGHSARVGALAWNGDQLSSGSRDRIILQRDVRSASAGSNPDKKLAGHKQEVTCQQFFFIGFNQRRWLCVGRVATAWATFSICAAGWISVWFRARRLVWSNILFQDL